MSYPGSETATAPGLPGPVRAELPGPVEILAPGREDLLAVALPRAEREEKAVVLALVRATRVPAGVKCNFVVKGRRVQPDGTTAAPEVHALLELGGAAGVWLYGAIFSRRPDVGPDTWTAALHTAGAVGKVLVATGSLLAVPEPAEGVDWGRSLAELIGHMKGEQ